MKAVVVEAPAKINLCLYVDGIGENGLHRICSLFQSITLADKLIVERDSEAAADRVTCPGVSGTNTVERALALFRERTGWDGPPVLVNVEKRIPIAAGLGGGSADAAALLRVLQSWAGEPLSRTELTGLAMEVGADVPSQLQPGLSLVTGAGEGVEALGPLPGFHIVLMPTAQGLSTGEVYRTFDGEGQATRYSGGHFEALERELAQVSSVAELATHRNDLEGAAFSMMPQLDERKKLLEGAGAEVVRLSGSGPALFGLFSGSDLAAQAAAKLKPHGAIEARPCEQRSSSRP